MLNGVYNLPLIEGSNEDDIIVSFVQTEVFGRKGADIILTGVGHDTIRGAFGDDYISSGAGNDEASGGAGEDTVFGGSGNDTVRGWYGNDFLSGDEGNDFIVDRFGSDTLIGGEGDDTLRTNSDGGEPIPAQDPKAIRNGGPVLDANDIMIGGSGRDRFEVIVRINAPKEILLKHADENGNIDWTGNGVAGENEATHDHYLASFGNDIIYDYDASEDAIAIIGHTVRINNVTQQIDAEGRNFTLIEAISDQGGSGAHHLDSVGTLSVYGDTVEPSSIITDPNVFHGMVQNINQLS